MPYKDIEQKRAYQKEWVAQNRAEFLQDKACVTCGSTLNLPEERAAELKALVSPSMIRLFTRKSNPKNKKALVSYLRSMYTARHD